MSSYCRPAFVEVYKLVGSCYGLSFRCLVETVAYRKKLSGEEQAPPATAGSMNVGLFAYQHTAEIAMSTTRHGKFM